MRTVKSNLDLCLLRKWAHLAEQFICVDNVVPGNHESVDPETLSVVP